MTGQPKEYNLGNEEIWETKNLDLACIGNCGYSCLLDKKAQIVWSCFPRFDGDPIFCSLLKQTSTYSNDIGFFDINMANYSMSEQHYIRNSAVLVTHLYAEDGACLEIKDFVPRFDTHEREYRPNMLIRIVTPINGRPRAQIRLRPTFGYGWGTPEKTRGSNHIRYLLSNMTIRLTTNAPVSYVVDEVLFEIDEPIFLILMPDESLKIPIQEMANSYLEKTLRYWTSWIRSLSIPFEWQQEVLRAAITLKMGNFEETGAIVAAMTTSIPQAPGDTSGESNFDLRYCWLRDAYWVVHALNQLGATTTMEGYLRFLSNIVASFHATKTDRRIRSVYGMSMETRLHERDMHRLGGYRGVGPVRLGNKDAETAQNDVYGAVILALTQIFFDKRLVMQGSEFLFTKMELLGEECVRIYKRPDFGPRGRTAPRLHTYSTVMCWAACDRLAKIAKELGLQERVNYWRGKESMIRDDVMKHAWNEKLQSFVSVWDTEEVDPYLIFLPEIGFLKPDDEKFLSTLSYLESKLVKNGFIVFFPDDTVAVNSITFRYIKVLADVGRTEEARKLFLNMLTHLNSSGMISETLDLEAKELWGNFPLNGAMVGLIFCAISLSKPWRDAL